jgi:hypothetical protein
VTETLTASASASAAPTIGEISLAEDSGRWERLGFTIDDGAVQLGAVRLTFEGADAGRGILGWSLRGAASSKLDGLPTVPWDLATPTAAPQHPNGVIAIDHVVAMSPQLDRSILALQSAGLDLRRIREQPTPAGAPRQAFFRLDTVILEVVQEPTEVIDQRSTGANGPARFWGMALLASDLDRTVAHLAEYASEIRPAVQPGRRIATLRRTAGLTTPIALMSRTEGPKEA